MPDKQRLCEGVRDVRDVFIREYDCRESINIFLFITDLSKLFIKFAVFNNKTLFAYVTLQIEDFKIKKR